MSHATELVAGEASEVGHRPVLPEERVHETVRRETAAHDLAGVVDAVRRAGTAGERAEVFHPPVLPAYRVTRGRRRGRESGAHVLPVTVERESACGTWT